MQITRKLVAYLLMSATSLALIPAAGLQAGGAGQKVNSADKQESPLLQRVSQLAMPKVVNQGVNMLSVSRQVLGLTREQQEQISDLQVQRRDEIRAMIRKENRKFNDRAAALLNADQKEKFETITGGLRDFRQKILAGVQDLKEVGGDRMAEWGGNLGNGKQLEILSMLDLTEEQKARVREQNREIQLAQRKARESIKSGQESGDPEEAERARQQATRSYQQAVKASRENIMALLTPEQTERLQQLQAAMANYVQLVQDAREDFTRKIQESLGQ